MRRRPERVRFADRRGICFLLFRVPLPLVLLVLRAEGLLERNLRRVVFKGGSCVLRIVDDLLPPSQFLYALRHTPAVQFLKAHSHMVSGPYPDHRKIHG